jgi:hypothetical protein
MLGSGPRFGLLTVVMLDPGRLGPVLLLLLAPVVPGLGRVGGRVGGF